MLLVACQETEESTNQYNLPAELKDCKIHSVGRKDGGSSIIVVRCPNSNTTTAYRNGKRTDYLTVLD
jgi:hypothetical protein